MKGQLRRIVLWGLLGLAVAAALAYAFQPRAVPVDLVAARREPLIVTIDGEGETRVREVYTVSAPISGRALRIEAKVGDAVTADETVLAVIEPEAPAFLDARSKAEAEAAVQTANAARLAAEADLRLARADLTFADSELERTRRLFETGTIPQRLLDAAERSQQMATATVDTSAAALRMRLSELDRARARLITVNEAQVGTTPRVPVRAPVSGRVLRVPHESEGVVGAGEPLIEVGDPADIEIVVDLLSSDAVKVEPGQRVVIENWGGPAPLDGRVRRIEPFGFTKISALGIEEQRVNVIIDIETPHEAWRALGHGYQVDTRIVSSEDEALAVPLTALFRDGNRWAVFAVEDGRAVRRHVAVGRLNREAAEILGGLADDATLIAHPSDRVTDGARVVERGGGT
ncbi:MAG: efflux RND transporter periplasmic adaptor subunit [Alphaproteobacteria bacterium]